MLGVETLQYHRNPLHWAMLPYDYRLPNHVMPGMWRINQMVRCCGQSEYLLILEGFVER